jgi:hypothetical protein
MRRPLSTRGFSAMGEAYREFLGLVNINLQKETDGEHSMNENNLA